MNVDMTALGDYQIRIEAYDIAGNRATATDNSVSTILVIETN